MEVTVFEGPTAVRMRVLVGHTELFMLWVSADARIRLCRSSEAVHSARMAGALLAAAAAGTDDEARDDMQDSDDDDAVLQRTASDSMGRGHHSLPSAPGPFSGSSASSSSSSSSSAAVPGATAANSSSIRGTWSDGRSAAGVLRWCQQVLQ